MASKENGTEKQGQQSIEESEKVYEEATTKDEWLRAYIESNQDWFRNYNDASERWVRHSNRILITMIVLVSITLAASLVKLAFFPDAIPVTVIKE